MPKRASHTPDFSLQEYDYADEQTSDKILFELQSLPRVSLILKLNILYGAVCDAYAYRYITIGI